MIDEETCEKLRIMFIDAQDNPRLSQWHRNVFCPDMAERLEIWGVKMNLSPKQLAILQTIHDRIYRDIDPTPYSRRDDDEDRPDDGGEIDLPSS